MGGGKQVWGWLAVLERHGGGMEMLCEDVDMDVGVVWRWKNAVECSTTIDVS